MQGNTNTTPGNIPNSSQNNISNRSIQNSINPKRKLKKFFLKTYRCF